MGATEDNDATSRRGQNWGTESVLWWMEAKVCVPDPHSFSLKVAAKNSCNSTLYALFSCICTVNFGRFLKDVVGGENVRKE